MRKEGFLRRTTNRQILGAREHKWVISLFTGAGGFDVGMCKAGFKTRVMVEWDKDCCNTIRANWYMEELKKREQFKDMAEDEIAKQITWYHDPEPVILQRDLTTLTTEEILKAGGLQVGDVSVVIGGSPCQGFSTAGKRCEDDPRNKLTFEYWRVVNEAMPKAFIFENVPGFVYGKNWKLIVEFCDKFAKSGYDVSWDIHNAADYGVPQNRKRVIIMGKRIDACNMINERIQYHIAAMPGKVSHPEWFIKKHKLRS